MPLPSYASSSDLAAWTGTAAPSNATQLLRSASLLVAQETVTAFYVTDNTGAPTDTDVIDALRDATCAQAAVWIGLGVDPNLNGLDRAAPKKGKKIGTATVEYDTSLETSTAAFTASQDATEALGPDAQRILRQAGLLRTQVWTYG